MAPVATMLALTLNYQNEISMCDLNISRITTKQHSMLRQSTSLAQEKQGELAEISQDDPQYYNKREEIKDKYEAKEKEIKELEDEMTLELDDWQDRRKMAQTYLQSYQAGLQSGLQSSFQPFPTQ